jgi:hypothetical protein
VAQCILEVTLVVNGDESVARLAVIRHLTAWYLEGRGGIGSLVQHGLNSAVELNLEDSVTDNPSFREVLANVRHEL